MAVGDIQLRYNGPNDGDITLQELISRPLGTGLIRRLLNARLLILNFLRARRGS